MLVSIIIFLAILSVLVIIHELGHFMVAKKLGIKVEEFGFGFPPRLFGARRGETIFSINLFPIGGFVKLHGEDDAGSGRIGGVKETGLDIKRAYYARPPWQRASVAVAGVVMNFLLAAVIFYTLFFFTNFTTTLPLLGDYNFWGAEQQNIEKGVYIVNVQEGSPAEEAGVREGSTIVEINSTSPDNLKEFTTVVDENRGEEVEVVLFDNKTGEEYTVNVATRPKDSVEKGGLGVGIEYVPDRIALLTYETFWQKLFSGFTYSINFILYSLQVFGELIADSFEQKSIQPVGEGVAGPVGIWSIVDMGVKIPNPMDAFLFLLNIAGMLSITLAFFNILPFPALDGGRLAFIVIEKVFGRGVGVKYESYAHAVGMIILLGLMLVITVRDIGRLF